MNNKVLAGGWFVLLGLTMVVDVLHGCQDFTNILVTSAVVFAVTRWAGKELGL